MFLESRLGERRVKRIHNSLTFKARHGFVNRVRGSPLLQKMTTACSTISARIRDGLAVQQGWALSKFGGSKVEGCVDGRIPFFLIADGFVIVGSAVKV